MVVERKYALTHLGQGDYLLPSNDAQTIWRIARYEDGPSHGLSDMERDREFWGLWKWRDRSPLGRTSQEVDVQDWERWSMEGAGFETRREAIDEALRTGS